MVDLMTQQRSESRAMPAERVRSPGLLAAAVVLQALFTVADLFSPGLVSVLYFIPLILVVWAGYDLRLRWFAVGLVLLNFLICFAKYHWFEPWAPPMSGLFDARVVNRTFVAIALCMLELLLEFRVATEFLRSDLELPEPFRREEEETDETAAMFIAVAATIVIFGIDLFLPRNFDLAVLYMVPLFLCVWSRSRKVLWSMAIAALVLSALGYFFGAPPTRPPVIHFPVNRVLTGVVTVMVAILLHFRGGLSAACPSRPSESRLRGNGATVPRVD